MATRFHPLFFASVLLSFSSFRVGCFQFIKSFFDGNRKKATKEQTKKKSEKDFQCRKCSHRSCSAKQSKPYIHFSAIKLAAGSQPAINTYIYAFHSLFNTLSFHRRFKVQQQAAAVVHQHQHRHIHLRNPHPKTFHIYNE